MTLRQDKPPGFVCRVRVCLCVRESLVLVTVLLRLTLSLHKYGTDLMACEP